MGRGRAIAAVLLAALTLGHAAEPAPEPAGRAHLEEVERQIRDMRQVVADAESALRDNQAGSVDLLYQTIRLAIVSHAETATPPPVAIDQLQAWYLKAMKDRDGFSPLEPASDALNLWRGLRRQEHALHDRYADLRVALRRLERLRDRLRRQLEGPPVGRP